MRLTKKEKIKKTERKKLRQYVTHKQSNDNFIETMCLKALCFSSFHHLLPAFSTNLNLEFRQNFRRHPLRPQLKIGDWVSVVPNFAIEGGQTGHLDDFLP
jgi:hypothetical protein